MDLVILSILEDFPEGITGYALVEELREPVSLAVRAATPSEADREEVVLKKLGARGWGRLHHFRFFYGPGWDERSGRPLSPRALEGF